MAFVNSQAPHYPADFSTFGFLPLLPSHYAMFCASSRSRCFIVAATLHRLRFLEGYWADVSWFLQRARRRLERCPQFSLPDNLQTAHAGYATGIKIALTRFH
jgi:hypothetical protein